ncbi:TRAP transporter substrate-binding protein DctP, partial [Thermodesulfovibrionales bacterium]|nr:TRAP transporter substrate-binding protein DctP [Thermodesulfovibrionales bacterium]
VMDLSIIDEFFIEQVREMSAGRLNITLFTAGELVPAFEVLDAAAAGVVQVASEAPTYWAGKNAAFDILGINPMAMTTLDYITWLYEGGGLELMREIYAQHGVHVIPTTVLPPDSGFHTVDVPLRTIADFEGMALRAPSASIIWLLDQIGAKGVKMPGGEVYMALELGTVDGAEFSTSSTSYLLKLHEVTRYWNTPAWFAPATVITKSINMDAWEALPDDLKAIVEAAGKATMTWSQSFLRIRDIEATERMLAHDLIHVTLDEESLLKIEGLMNQWHEKQAAACPDYARVLKSQMEFLKAFRTQREMDAPFGFGRNLTAFPEVQ